jgi:transcriptional regulator with XRE-family HTH domain
MNFDFPATSWHADLVPERVKQLLAEAREWCSQERGRQTRLAKILGVSPQALSAWWTGYAGKQPTAEQALALDEFFRRERRKRK